MSEWGEVTRDLLFAGLFGLFIIWWTAPAEASERVVRCEVAEVSAETFRLRCNGELSREIPNDQLHPAFRRVGMTVVFTPSPEFARLRAGHGRKR